jgi:hypothetical protein
MPRGLKITNRANQVIFNSAWIAGMDYDEELFDDDIDDDYDEEDNDEENENENENNDQYNKMDENDMANILQQPNDVPQETENEHEIVFEEANDAEEPQEEEVSSQDKDDDYKPGNDEDISLEVDDDDGEEEDDQGKRRTERVRVPPTSWQHLQARDDNTEHYSSESAQIIAMTMVHYNTEFIGMNDTQASSFLQTYSLKQGIKKFGEQGIKAVHKEMKQIHDRVVFKPISIEKITILKRKRAVESLIFLTEKRDETIKARVCANGSTQRAYIARGEASSPTAASEAILITGVIDAKQNRDVMTLDIPNAFVQTGISLNGDTIIMKIRGQLVDILLELCPGVYDDYDIIEGKHKVLYVRMLKTLYGMLISSIMYYKKFRKDIESIGFEVNPYDICVANRKVNGKQQTVT